LPVTPMTTSAPQNHDTIADLHASIAEPPAWLVNALKVPREEGWVDANGCQIHYFRWGDPSKPPLVLLHGFLAHARCFAFIAPFLAQDFHVVAYDFSGMGDSGARDDYPESVRVDELMAVAKHTQLFNGVQKPTIIAHSYGGRIGLEAVQQYPDAFAGIVICDLMIIRPEVLEANAEHFRRPGSQDSSKPNRVYPDFESAKKRFVLAPPQVVEVPALFDFMAYHSLKQVEGGWTWKFDTSVYNVGPDGMKKWAKTGQMLVSAPGKKAVVYGAESFLFSADSADYVRELGGTNFPIIEIPNARHHLMLDQPIACSCVLKTILASWA